jgi:hypothetical protein
MLESIEGISNLNRLEYFLNKELINPKADLKKKIAYEISNGKSSVVCSVDQIYNEIIELLGKEHNRHNGEVVSKPAKTAVPVAQNIASTVTLSDYAVKNISVPLKADPVPNMTAYEGQDYNKVLYGGSNVYDTGLEQERTSMLDDIDELRSELSNMEGINIRTIPMVERNSSIGDIRNVYKLLLHKKNMGMYFETARDVLMIGINNLVNFCDGRPGRPNLTGWQSTASLRLNSLKTELASMVSGFFKNYSIPPVAQILLSLVPSAFLHASLRERQTGMQATNSEALSDLRRMMD